MKQRSRQTPLRRDPAELAAEVEAGRARFRRLPERVPPRETFVSVPVSSADPARDSFDHDEWLARNLWCGALL